MHDKREMKSMMNGFPLSSEVEQVFPLKLTQ
jgi:hypothetical protein